ncbi:ATP-binding protein [uncultured Treponema sp.]|uniref:ATP-binding protein n=1 Tax=uncultured Treponema sp. TaxID=162155 RepID=UPI0025FC3A64|nr:ATP-binding protein [uncultured Treponema sp.]
MKKKYKQSLRTQTIGTCIFLVLFAFFLTAGVILLREVRDGKTTLMSSMNITADKKALELDFSMLSVERAVFNAQDYILRTIDEDRILRDSQYEKEYMAALGKELISLTGIAQDAMSLYFRLNIEKFGGKRGIFLEGDIKRGFISVSPTDLSLYNPNDIEHVGWYYIPLWKKSPVWTAPYENKNLGITMISFIIPIYKDNSFLGVVGMDINLATIKNVIDTLPVENQLAILISEDGSLIYFNNAHLSQQTDLIKQTADISEIMDIFSTPDDGELSTFNWNNDTHYGIKRKLQNDMILIVSISEKAMQIVRKQMLMPILLTFLAVLLLTILALYLALKNIIKPISIISDATFKLARGELNIKIPYESNNELGKLSNNIRMMITQMQEYIEYIREQIEKERTEKEAAISGSKSKSEFLASIYFSLHELDLNTDTFTEIQVHSEVAKSIGNSMKNARATVRRVMEERVMNTGKEREDFMEFINFDTLEERMKGKKSIAHEFKGALGSWCRARFILVDRNPDGTLHHVLWAIENIAEERAVREKLQSEAERQTAASQAKSAFLANMSHEIRTPINAVLGMDEMILRESNDKTILGYAANIKTASSNLLSIVNDILDFSKIEAGKMELIPENYDISSVVVDLVNMISERAKKKGLNFILQADPTIPKSLYGDSIRIKQCILNLLTNAVKYTHKGSVKLEISCDKLEGENKILLKVSVKDTGIGIKEEDMKRLFSPFERIEENRNKTIEGTGLGMSIVMKMLAMMNTKLDVKSVYGSGSEFSFVVEQGVVDWQEVGDINTAYEESIETMARYKEKLHAPKAHLLFVDDTEMNLEVIKGLLKKTGIKLDTVLSGKAALEKVKENCYDIIFIDHRMPEMDGIETLHAMQSMADNKSKGKPCVALTANALTGVKKMYLEEGFTDYLSKPVNPEKLEEMIRRYLPEDYIEENWEDESEENDDEAKSEILEKLRGIEGIDADAAIANCATSDILENAVKNFYNTIDDKKSELEKFFANEDWENYCTKVHALKSSSRLIGALDLSQKAAWLEEKSEKKEADEIRAKHPELMELYASFKEKLNSIVNSGEETSSEKSEISESELKDKLARLNACAISFDMDGMDEIMAEFSAFKIPPSFAEKFDKIRTAATNVDFKELRNLLKE